MTALPKAFAWFLLFLSAILLVLQILQGNSDFSPATAITKVILQPQLQQPNNLNGTVEDVTTTINITEPTPIVNLTTQPIKILVWKNTHNRPSSNTAGRITRWVAEMNQEDGAFCRNEYGDGDPSWNDLTCQFTLDAEAVREADAVSFYMFNSGYNACDLPEYRTPNQIWTSFVQESPIHSGWVTSLNNTFNWTMSYRSDSEILNPYGRTLKLKKPLGPNEPIMFQNVTLKDWVAGKTKLVAGVISNCHPPSRRDKLIAKMQKTGTPIDIYGGCGKFKVNCSLDANYNQQCGDQWHKFASEYKFFLAFENSLCRDYITEKFWRTLEMGMVPVVYGGGYYRQDAPPYSYIDARDFHSAGELVKYLVKLGNDTKEYSRYFEWRKKYTVEQKWSRGYCNLCKAVRDHKTGSLKLDKVYPNLRQWWKTQPGSDLSACEPAQEFVD